MLTISLLSPLSFSLLSLSLPLALSLYLSVWPVWFAWSAWVVWVGLIWSGLFWSVWFVWSIGSMLQDRRRRRIRKSLGSRCNEFRPIEKVFGRISKLKRASRSLLRQVFENKDSGFAEMYGFPS